MKTVMMSIRVDEALCAQLVRKAWQINCSATPLIREFMRDFIRGDDEINADDPDAPDDLSEAERRYIHEQSLASARLEGFVPDAEFLTDCAAVIAGRMTNKEACARNLARVLAKYEASKQKESATSNVDNVAPWGSFCLNLSMLLH
jgi:hypothetical protein